MILPINIVKHELPNHREKRKPSDTAEYLLNLALMHSDLWTRFKGDQTAETAHHAEQKAIQDEWYESARINAINQGIHTQLFNTPYDQDREAESVAERIALEAESPQIASLAAHRAKKLLEPNSDIDQEDRSDIA